MGTIGKALTLLDILSRFKGDAGLTELAAACGYDKATTRRFLVELEKHGFVEQMVDSRKYRLGAAPLRLARIREDRYPLLRTAIPIVRALMEETGETVHLSQFTNGRLSTIHVEECDKAHRVFIDIGIVLPFHATASGLAYLAAASPDFIAAELAGRLDAFTGFTIVDPAGIRERIAEARARGFSVNQQGMEAGVVSASAAILAPDRTPIGCITVAAPLVRTDEARILSHGAAARTAAGAIEMAFFGSERSAVTPLLARRIDR
jgi:IclR family acetate operon transcriptional repressor